MPFANDDGPQQVRDLNANRDETRSLAGAFQSRFLVLFGSIWLAVGLPFALLAGYFIVQERRVAATERIVEATVLAKDIKRDGKYVKRSVTYRFTVADDQTIEGASEVGESVWNSLAERGPVTVTYLPHQPSVNRVADTDTRTLLLIFSFIGGFFSLAGGTIVTVALRNARTRRSLPAGEKPL